MSTHCAVIGCTNGDYKLSRWQQEECEIQKVIIMLDALVNHHSSKLGEKFPKALHYSYMTGFVYIFLAGILP